MNTKIFASIITIGDELLIGQVIDTNSAFIAQELNKIGINVKHRLAIGDNEIDIVDALNYETTCAEIIILTGGLGPTADDITKPTLCKYFNGKMIVDNETLEHVKYLFEHVLKRPMIDRNLKQAEVPSTCKVLKNEVGTAPAMMFEQNGKLFFSLPGVPHEMKWIIQNHIIPLLKSKLNSSFIEHRTIVTAGVGESFIAERLVEFENNLPQHITLAYLPNYRMVRLRLTASGNNKTEVIKAIETQFNQLQQLVNDITISNEDLKLEEIIANTLVQKNKTISTAESCTGGYIAHLLTNIAGSSAFYKGSIVSYSNDIKESILKVSNETLKNFGAVSQQTVEQMAGKALELLQTDYVISVSGIMGPTGGTIEKPVGTVWVAIASKNKTESQLFNFRFDRKKNIELTAMNALLFLLSFMKK